MPNLFACHNSRELAFRQPFGAVRTGAHVTLRLYLWGPWAQRAEAVLRTWNGSENYYPGASAWRCGARVFTFRIKAPDAPCVLWYNFRVTVDGRLYYVGAADGILRSGESKLTRDIPHDFRITVYDRGFDTPEGFRGRIAYQIFPDRFARGESGGADPNGHAAYGWRMSEKRWDEEVDHLPRDGEKYYSPQDHYLGNFAGIREKIPYLESLGIGVIYLNPIFLSPYNHRYSISDYMKVDPLLGTEEEFASLCAELKAHGIKVILDGVFSHTGDDSIYFDKFGKFGGGAYLDPDSPYREWYVFSESFRHGYRCWWDFESLPEVDELTPSYMEFIARVLEKWIRLGASGWRLDVADELPDEFIKFLRLRLKAIDPEALLIGEVWEDAALKEDGFGRRREYVNGLELDGVMDYPFLEAAVSFLLGGGDSFALRSALGAQLEGYPSCFMRAQLGMLGSHDTERILSVLAGGPIKSGLSRPEQLAWRPAPESEAIVPRRLMLASALQFSMPFMPCVYYGDEAGLRGLADPFCRRPYPWGHENAQLLSHYRRIAAVRGENGVFITGLTSFAAPDPDVFAIARTGGGEALTVLNRSQREARITLAPEDFSEGEAAPALRGEYEAAISGKSMTADGFIELDLPPLSFEMLILRRPQ